MWSTAAIVLASFIGGVSVTLFCVFMNTVVGDIRGAVKDTNTIINMISNQLNTLIADSKTKHDMVLHEIEKIQKTVKELHVEPISPGHPETNLDSRSV